MRLAVVAAGFTPGEADQLRRAMAAWRRPGVIDQFRKKLLDGMRANGLPAEFAERVFEQIRGFGEYGFPESHAASFALLVYVSAWLKHYYPAAFARRDDQQPADGLLRPGPARARCPRARRGGAAGGCESQRVGLHVGGRMRNAECGVRSSSSTSVLQSSAALRTPPRPPPGPRPAPKLTPGDLRSAAATGPFASLADFARRTGLGQAVIARLAEADAFGSLELDRRAALWQALGQEQKPQPLPLLAGLDGNGRSAGRPAADDAAGRSRSPITARPASRCARIRSPSSGKRSNGWGVAPAAELERLAERSHVRVAGLVLVRQRPGTAKGITFVTLEDETGTANLIIRQNIWQRYYRPPAPPVP